MPPFDDTRLPDDLRPGFPNRVARPGCGGNDVRGIRGTPAAGQGRRSNSNERCWKALLLAPMAGWLVFAGAQPARAADLPTGAGARTVEDFIFHGKGFEVGDSLEAIRESLGEPLARRDTKIANRHVPGQQDQIIQLVYDGLEIGIYRVNGSPPRDIVSHLAITDERYPARHGVAIGIPSDRLRALLGNPTEQDGGTWTYRYLDGPGDDKVVFHFRENLLKKIEWSWPVD